MDAEERRKYHREWEAKNKDKVRGYYERKYKKHKSKMLKASQQFYAEHRDRYQGYQAKRLAAKHDSDPTFVARKKLRDLYQKDPRSRRRFYRHSRYLPYEDYQRLLPQLENGPCDCCGRSGPMHIDHDHVTMQFRGVLCGHCNKGLGHFGDDPERVDQAAAYLRRTKRNG